jgi:diadenosine tetraphosphate (Ap4A) HIT family hydrolase
MVTAQHCVFCQRVQTGHVIAANNLACAFHDAFPVSDGHTLIVPKDHIARYSDLSIEAQAAMWNLARDVMTTVQTIQRVDGFNLGINDGTAAGQTIDHAHLHVIPRVHGDVEDPRGGIRWVMPEKAKYWPS